MWNVPSLKWEQWPRATFCTYPHGSGFCLASPDADEWRCRNHQTTLVADYQEGQDVIDETPRSSWYWQGPDNQSVDLATRHVYENETRLGRLNWYLQQLWLD